MPKNCEYSLKHDLRVTIFLREIRQNVYQSVKLPPDDTQTLSDLKHRGVVHDILGCGTPVNILCQFRGRLLDELPYQW